jgi:hypothetical protein
MPTATIKLYKKIKCEQQWYSQVSLEEPCFTEILGYKPGIDLSIPSRPSVKATGEMTNLADCKKTNGDEDSAASTLPAIRIEGVKSSFD